MNLSSSVVYNETDPCGLLVNFSPYILYITLIISFVSICECLVVIFVTWVSENLHGNTNMYVSSLAVNDLFLAIAFIGNQVYIVPFFFPYLIKSKLVLCLISGLTSATTILSVLHMAVIALDRYIQISQPFYYMKSMTKRRTYVVLLGLWITGFIYTIIPPIICYNDQYHIECILLYQPAAYFIIEISSYILSIIMVFICYFNIAYVAFKHKQSTISRRLASNLSSDDIDLNDKVKAALRSVKFFVLMFGVLFSCTFPPYCVIVFGEWFAISENVYTGLFSLVPIHSAINCLIYAYMNKQFYTALLKVVNEMKESCKYTREM